MENPNPTQNAIMAGSYTGWAMFTSARGMMPVLFRDGQIACQAISRTTGRPCRHNVEGQCWSWDRRGYYPPAPIVGELNLYDPRSSERIRMGFCGTHLDRPPAEVQEVPPNIASECWDHGAQANSTGRHS